MELVIRIILASIIGIATMGMMLTIGHEVWDHFLHPFCLEGMYGGTCPSPYEFWSMVDFISMEALVACGLLGAITLAYFIITAKVTD